MFVQPIRQGSPSREAVWASVCLFRWIYPCVSERLTKRAVSMSWVRNSSL
jgi:hypothetical protein